MHASAQPLNRTALSSGICSQPEHETPQAARRISRFSASSAHPDCIARTFMKPTLIVLAFISLAGSAIIFPRIVPARAFSIHGAEPIGAGSCEDRYNSSLKNAKAALTAGDRAATVEFLHQAKRVLARCPALQNGSSSQAAALALNTF